MNRKELDRFNVLIDMTINEEPMTYEEREEYNKLCELWHDTHSIGRGGEGVPGNNLSCFV